MRRQLSSFALMVCGIIALVGGFTMLPVPVSVSAQPAEPSPRPTLQPTAEPAGEPAGDDGHKATPVIPGRLTGTIIDLRTHAPVPGVAVTIGDQTVYSDANGNYDIWLTSGYYRVNLELASGQGSAGQAAQAVAIGPGDTVVVHLFFTSPAPSVVAAPPAAPPALDPTPTVAPPVALPPSLPDSSVAEPAEAAVPVSSLPMPQSLPNTAATGGLGAAGTWILFGAVLLGLGLVVQLAPRPRRQATLPQRRAARSRRRDDDAVLADLLDRDLP